MEDYSTTTIKKETDRKHQLFLFVLFFFSNLSFSTASTTLIFPIINDAKHEHIENFFFRLNTAIGATIIRPQTRINILDTDKVALPTIFINDITVDEAEGTANLTVSLSTPSATPVTFVYFTGNSSAISGIDFIRQSSTIVIPVGSTLATITLPLIDDNKREPTENFVVTLGSVQGAMVVDNQGTVTIADNDQITTLPTCNKVRISTDNTNEASIQASSNDVATTLRPQIRISPNPVKNLLSIKTSGFSGTSTRIMLLSQVGQIVKQIQWTYGTNNLQMNVQNLESGLYYLTTRLVSGEILTKKIVITK